MRGHRPPSMIGTTLAPHAEPAIAREDELVADPHVMQQFVRRHRAPPRETIWSRAGCGAAGAGSANHAVHISFCPPFASTPELEFEQADGQPAP